MPVGTSQSPLLATEVKQPRKRRALWIITAVVTAIAFCAAVVAADIAVHRAVPIVKKRILESLSVRFNARVELDSIGATVSNVVEVTGGGLRIYAPDDEVAAGVTQPLISIDQFSFRSSLMNILRRQMHVGTVNVTGLHVYIPPREQRGNGSGNGPRRKGKLSITIDQLVCDASGLTIGTIKPGKDPKVFVVRHVVLNDITPSTPMRYDATLINAIPRGDIHAVGTFGPWDNETPGESFLSGNYLFDKADLGTIRGIGGTLTSTGKFQGQLAKISVEGESHVPDFSIDTANHPMDLHTRFQTIVDGTTGDTYLTHVDAQLAQTKFTTTGSVVSIKGVGHQIDLDADIPAGHVQDFLNLAVKTQPPLMTGIFTTRMKIHIAAGKDKRVVEKLSLNGPIQVRQIHFSNPQFEDKVDMLSLRAQGDPKDARPGAADVHSALTAQLSLNAGRMNLSHVVYTVPGAQVNLNGIYSLDGQQFDFHGTVQTQAKISQMVSSGWKSMLLRTVDPFFRGPHGGADIPVHISGTRSAPKFGLDLHYKDEQKIDAQADGKH